MLFAAFSPVSGANLQPQLPVVPRRSTSILDKNKILAGDMNLPPGRNLVNDSVINRVCSGLDSTASTTNTKRLGCPSRF